MGFVKSVVKIVKKNKRNILIFLIAIFCLILTGCGKEKSDSKYTIISTSFPGYDFARAIVKESDVEVKMLLSPGSETHSYEPTPQDIIDISNCDIFIYIGGESDSWIEDVLDDIDKDKTKIIKLMDLVDVVEEEYIDGMEKDKNDEIELDEHVWTSPVNAMKIVNKLKDEIISIDQDNSDLYEENANSYISEINSIDLQIKDIVSNSKRKELVFGDRFPIRYFTDLYGITYYAAFKGCSEQSEASAKTITFLIDKVKSNEIPVVLKIELSNGGIANAIAEETNTKVLEFHSAHNITQKDFDNGITYVDIMKRNIEVLKEALN